mmetsp:Transcript_74613/g.147809  ORF Transcript_74613/g.147809 Transcript_74613/m.147809 type:complete len:210 (-) Transcript_74613:101-730(-)
MAVMGTLVFAAFCLASQVHATRLRPNLHVVSKHHATSLVPLPPMYTPWKPSAKDDQDVINGKVSLLHSHLKKKHHIGNDDDLELPASFFKVKEPKQDFKMDESSNILYSLLGEFGKTTYLQFAAKVAAEHKLSDAKQAKLVGSLKQSLLGFQAGGHDFMLDAARVNYPSLNEHEQRTRLIQMLQVMLKNATKAAPPEDPRFAHHRNHKK